MARKKICYFANSRERSGDLAEAIARVVQPNRSVMLVVAVWRVEDDAQGRGAEVAGVGGGGVMFRMLMMLGGRFVGLKSFVKKYILHLVLFYFVLYLFVTPHPGKAIVVFVVIYVMDGVTKYILYILKKTKYSEPISWIICIITAYILVFHLFPLLS